MAAFEYDCRVTSIVWISPKVFTLRFEPSRPFSYEPGQFLSVILPGQESRSRLARRIYSFSSSGKKDGYELCVKYVPGGRGSSYLASLKPGDAFRISAPFGDFVYETEPHRNACMIATSTGIAPFKSMIESDVFRKNPAQGTLLILGAENEKEILFPGLFEKQGAEVTYALSRPSPDWTGFKGRVTDYLNSLPASWPWQETDFYLCGNAHMIEEVRQILIRIRHVPSSAVREEAYFSTHLVPQKIAA